MKYLFDESMMAITQSRDLALDAQRLQYKKNKTISSLISIILLLII